MINFIIGFVVAWVLFALVVSISDAIGGSISLWDGFETYLILLPIIPLLLLSMYIDKIKRKEKRK